MDLNHPAKNGNNKRPHQWPGGGPAPNRPRFGGDSKPVAREEHVASDELDIPPNVVKNWEAELAKLDLGQTQGVTFAHLQTEATSCVTRFIMRELVARSATADEADDDPGPSRTVAYVLHDQAAVEMIKSIAPKETAADGLWIGTPEEIINTVRYAPQALTRLVVVFDTDNGRYPTKVVVAAGIIAEEWAALSAKKVYYSSALVVVSPHRSNRMWSFDSIARTFREEGKWKDLSLRPPTTHQAEVEHTNLTETLTARVLGDQTINLMSVEHHHIVVVAVLPEALGREVRQALFSYGSARGKNNAKWRAAGKCTLDRDTCLVFGLNGKVKDTALQDDRHFWPALSNRLKKNQLRKFHESLVIG
ncbi:hypothetical protein QBC34DRAFT_202015 [Podospora aff. communis PSN243]|uniref:Uncharacterized protein n=1 Tax=Podospora aff. communis PSN243 TaxID=3040156 RepID=A0AAV9G6H8_9PEZI|nr:hypothetical protein QBC34DRAFT_202015 [Podospora aff. communis PSN243]